MKLKTISVTYGRKINLGDYNSAELGLSLWADIDEEDETEDEAIRNLQITARNMVREEFVRLREQVKSQANGKVK